MLGNKSGFTLIEVLIAIAIMTVAFTSIFIVQSNSINAVRSAKNTNIVSMLIKNYMIETEQEFEGRAFTEVPKDKNKTCDEAFSDYKCSRVIKEIQFPQLSFGQQNNNPNNSSGGDAQMVEKIGKLITKFLSQAIREVTVTVTWGKKVEEKVSMTTYWVNLNQEFSINE